MRLLYVADGRSPIALNWMRYFVERGDDVFLASTFACSPDLALKGLEITPVAFSGGARVGRNPAGRSTFGPGIRLRLAIRHLLGPLTISRASKRLRSVAAAVKPDLVHALRIPYEGMLAADANAGTPLLVSVWGNDFTLHAPASALMRHYTSWTLQVAAALHTDCQRDVRLGKHWGFDPHKPTFVAPGNGGVDTAVFYPPASPVEEPIVVNPRGARAYVRNDIFFRAIPLVLATKADARFVCVGMAEDAQARGWVRELGITSAVDLLPPVPHAEMAGIFRRAQVMVSPAVHDGTPNSLLEAMACGCLPVAGDLDSIREWITPGSNGLVADPTDPGSLARAILEGLANQNLRQRAAGRNHNLILDRAEYRHCMTEAGQFYRRVIAGS
jgi:glycosyltransferase involved in cell wall biosynthesis